jgi:hypothetical protein
MMLEMLPIIGVKSLDMTEINLVVIMKTTEEAK